MKQSTVHVESHVPVLHKFKSDFLFMDQYILMACAQLLLFTLLKDTTKQDSSILTLEYIQYNCHVGPTPTLPVLRYVTDKACLPLGNPLLRPLRERPLDFQGGGLGFLVWPEYFFLSLSGPKYFFSNYHEPEYFFLKPYWARIFFSIQYKFGSNFSVEPQIGYKTIILRLFVVCLCVCPTAMTLSGITLPIQNTLQYHFM